MGASAPVAYSVASLDERGVKSQTSIVLATRGGSRGARGAPTPYSHETPLEQEVEGGEEGRKKKKRERRRRRREGNKVEGKGAPYHLVLHPPLLATKYPT